MLNTPLSEFGHTLSAQDDTELSQLVGDQSGVQTALLTRSQFFAAVQT